MKLLDRPPRSVRLKFGIGRGNCAVARGVALKGFVASVLRQLLTIAFAHRHRAVRAGSRPEPLRAGSRWAAAVALLIAPTLQTAVAEAQTPPAVRTVPFVDLDRYAGEWFEIARFPNRFSASALETSAPPTRVDLTVASTW